MYTVVRLKDILGVNSVLLDEFPYPLQVFDWEYPMKGDDITKAFAPGQFDTRKHVDYMTINCEGEIVTDTTALYWASRKALVACVLPQYVQTVGEYNHSRLEITLDDNTSYFAEVTLVQHSIPVAAKGSPTVSPFMITWKCNLGYWSAAGTSTPALI